MHLRLLKHRQLQGLHRIDHLVEGKEGRIGVELVGERVDPDQEKNVGQAENGDKDCLHKNRPQ